MNAPERCLLLVFSAVLIAMLAPVQLLAAEGIQIVVIEPAGNASFLVKEFVDCSVLAAIVPEDSPGFVWTPSAGSGGGSGSGTDEVRSRIIACRQEPLLVFASVAVERLEQRIAEADRTMEEIALENELRREILLALFQPPFWPYLALSEIPVRGIELTRSYQLPYHLEEQFPAATFAGEGEFPLWDVDEITPQGVSLLRSGDQGQGMGITTEYFLEGPLDRVSVRVIPGARVMALYVLDNSSWGITGVPVAQIPARELVGLVKETSFPKFDRVPVSVVHIQDSMGTVGRHLVAPSHGGATAGLSWSPVPWPPAEERGFSSGETAVKPRWSPRTYSAAIIACWLVFGLTVMAGNLFWRYSALPPVSLVAVAMLSYPAFLLVSLLSGGFWGMGFVVAAGVAARVLGSEGLRVRAFFVFLAATFAVSLAAWLASLT